MHGTQTLATMQTVAEISNNAAQPTAEQRTGALKRLVSRHVLRDRHAFKILCIPHVRKLVLWLEQLHRLWRAGIAVTAAVAQLGAAAARGLCQDAAGRARTARNDESSDGQMQNNEHILGCRCVRAVCGVGSACASAANGSAGVMSWRTHAGMQQLEFLRMLWCFDGMRFLIKFLQTLQAVHLLVRAQLCTGPGSALRRPEDSCRGPTGLHGTAVHLCLHEISWDVAMLLDVLGPMHLTGSEQGQGCEAASYGRQAGTDRDTTAHANAD